MNRDLKFRVWDGRILGEKMLSSQEAMHNSYLNIEDSIGSDITIKTSNAEKVIIMQYTGLKDKNGVEIYEGDLLKINKGQILVGFSVGSFVGYRPTKYIDSKPVFVQEIKHSTELGWFPNDFEVIGNIYENENLL